MSIMLLTYTKLNENLIDFVSDKYDHKLKRDLNDVCNLLEYTLDEVYPEYRKHIDIITDYRNSAKLKKKHYDIIYTEFNKYPYDLYVAWFDMANRGCEYFEVAGQKGDSFYKIWSDNVSEISNLNPYMMGN